MSPAPTAFDMQRNIPFLMSRSNSHILQLFFSLGELLVDVFLQKCLLVYMAVDVFFGGAFNGCSHSKCRYEARDSNIRL